VAEAKKKRRVVKKSETVRERASKSAEAKPKPRHLHRTVHRASGPLKSAAKAIGKALRPLSFLLVPFKTRPARFVGRILAKVLLLNYVKNSWQELRLVEWINRRDTLKLTGAVFVFAIAFGLTVALLDYGLDKVFKALILN
jgi:preprotein translocase SecE subunit